MYITSAHKGEEGGGLSENKTSNWRQITIEVQTQDYRAVLAFK